VPPKDKSGKNIPQTPAEELIRLRKCREQRQAEQKAAEANLEFVEAQIAALASLADEFEKIVTDYLKDRQKLYDQQQGYRQDFEYEKACLENILPPGAPAQIKGIAQPFKDEIAQLQKALQDGEIKLVELKQKRDVIGKDRDTAKTVLEMWKKPAASIAARLGQAKGFQDQVKKAHDANQFATAYWLLTDDTKFQGKLTAEPQVVTADELRERLKTAWQGYRSKLDAYRIADEAVKSLEKTLETKKARLTEAVQKLDASISAALSNVKPK
jgi:hypothetical protein